MSKAKNLKAILAGAATLLMLSACASRGDIDGLDSRVSTLENQVTAAQNRASAAEARASKSRNVRQSMHLDLPERQGKCRSGISKYAEEIVLGSPAFTG